jgi:hypothetical protein
VCQLTKGDRGALLSAGGGESQTFYAKSAKEEGTCL